MSLVSASFIPVRDASLAIAANLPHPATQIAQEFQSLPITLLRPFLPLFENVELPRPDHFLAGLRAECLLGARVLLPGVQNGPALAWVGARLRASVGKLFDDLRGGC